MPKASVTRHIEREKQKLIDFVLDIEKYPEFIPFCIDSKVYEKEDNGITRFGRQVIREMNRVGMVVDMSHSGERSTLDAIELSERPITITHANLKSWHLKILKYFGIYLLLI